jgi:hypothetical protein
MISSYVKRLPAQFHTTCANCGHDCIPGDVIYWHGRGMDQRQLGSNTHEGCFWNAQANGPAPHLTWEQITAISNAIAHVKLPTDDDHVRRFLGSVRVAIGRRKYQVNRLAHHAGLRMGPDLLDGYYKVLNAAGLIGSTWWQPKEANGVTAWVDPCNAPKVERPRAEFSWDESRLRIEAAQKAARRPAGA